MAKDKSHKQEFSMCIQVDTDTPFHLGWLSCLLGLPRDHPRSPDGSFQLSFQDGWDMCSETGITYAAQALPKMIKLDQVSAYWVDDNGNEIEMKGGA